MEKSVKKMASHDLESLISNLKEEQILTPESMRSIRGGDGDGGGDGIIIPPKQV